MSQILSLLLCCSCSYVTLFLVIKLSVYSFHRCFVLDGFKPHFLTLLISSNEYSVLEAASSQHSHYSPVLLSFTFLKNLFINSS